MSTSIKTISFLLDQLSSVNGISSKRMFGEYCLYLNQIPIGFICNDQLFIKQTESNEKLLIKKIVGYPYPRAKPYFLITADQWEDSQWLGKLILTTGNEVTKRK